MAKHITKSVQEYFEQYKAKYNQFEIDEQLNKEASEMEKYTSLIDKEDANKRTEKVYEKQKDQNLNKVIPSIFAESIYLLDGRPFRLTNRDFLRFIYDADIRDGLLMCGRQVEKSTTFSIHQANWTLLTPFFRSLYFAPLNEQVKMYSEDRLGRLFQYSNNDVIKNTFITTHDKQNVFNKSFSNGSLIYLRHCYGLGDNIRGLSVNGVFGDEIQDIDIDALPVIKETQAHALDLGPGVCMTWFAGTPKTYSNTIQQLWDESNQCEWVVRCPHCNKDQVLGLENITETKYLCRNPKCRKEITHFDIAKRGRWIKMNEKSEVWGFRITQLMSPAMPASEVYKKTINYDKQRLYNEVLGRSYENAEKPFTPTLIAFMTNNEYRLLTKAEGIFNNRPVYMGIDWGTGGKSYTVVSVFSWNDKGQFQLLYTKRYAKGMELERDFQVADIIKLFNLFRVHYCIADYGHGFQANQQLKNKLGERFDCMYYSHNLREEKIYDLKKKMWVANRTKTIHNYVVACQNGKVVWPGADKEQYEFLLQHHLAEQTEYRSTKPKLGQNVLVTRSEEMYYSHPVNQPDDGLHSCVYAFAAWNIKPHGINSGIKFSGAYSR